MKSTLVSPLLVLLLIGAVGCGDASEEEATLPRITIGHVGHDHQIALFVAALDPDRFKERCGIWLSEKKPKEVYDLMKDGKALAELHLMKVGGGSKMPAAMERGDIDVGLGGIPAVVFGVDKGNAFRIISPMNVDGDMLLVRPDFPADDWAGFVKAVRESERPVKIGYKAPVAVAKLVLMGALNAEGVPHGEGGVEGGVELVNLRGGGKVVPSLEKGIVDGAVINEPFGSLAVFKKVGKIVSMLADLPPEGHWKAHPCCCICATESAIAEHRDALKALLTLTRDATAFILEDREAAARLASRWTGQELDVEMMSVPNIAYMSEFSDLYRSGLATWFKMMQEVGQFEGRLKEMAWDDALALTHDFSLLEEIR